MPTEMGRYGLKSWSYTHYVTEDGGILCEACVAASGLPAATTDQWSPIFADQEWNYYPECDACGDEADYVTLLTDTDE